MDRTTHLIDIADREKVDPHESTDYFRPKTICNYSFNSGSMDITTDLDPIVSKKVTNGLPVQDRQRSRPSIDDRPREKNNFI